MLPFVLSNQTVTLRSIEKSDEELLFAIYASTREEELKLINFWTQEQKALFLRQQFYAQHNYYQEHFGQSFFGIILKDNTTAIGRLYINFFDENNTISVIDIALFPQYRGNGIGKSLLDDILAYAKSISKRVEIYVEATNPAKRLYDRLGFSSIEEGEIYLKMEWLPHEKQEAILV
jgi:ribosomal protein S18 acetylase RimI-like enzyme